MELDHPGTAVSSAGVLFFFSSSSVVTPEKELDDFIISAAAAAALPLPLDSNTTSTTGGGETSSSSSSSSLPSSAKRKAKRLTSHEDYRADNSNSTKQRKRGEEEEPESKKVLWSWRQRINELKKKVEVEERRHDALKKRLMARSTPCANLLCEDLYLGGAQSIRGVGKFREQLLHGQGELLRNRRVQEFTLCFHSACTLVHDPLPDKCGEMPHELVRDPMVLRGQDALNDLWARYSSTYERFIWKDLKVKALDLRGDRIATVSIFEAIPRADQPNKSSPGTVLRFSCVKNYIFSLENRILFATCKFTEL